jgi:hypothetical protein
MTCRVTVVVRIPPDFVSPNLYTAAVNLSKTNSCKLGIYPVKYQHLEG